MKPQDIFEQVLNVQQCHEANEQVFMATGTTVVELPDIPLGTSVLASFLLVPGVVQFNSPPNVDCPDKSEPIILGRFAMKLTLEPITE